MADSADAFVSALLEAGVATGNKLTAATSVGTGASDDDAYQLLIDLGTKLTENNVPNIGRWVAVPPWYRGMLMKDPRFVSFGTSENRTTLKNGVIGDVDGMKIVQSNNITSSTVIAGYKGAAAYAEQINDTKAYEPPESFSDALKGLHLYGAKVTRPNALASVVVTSA
jgi:N4-gp56 family major capsid protein